MRQSQNKKKPDLFALLSGAYITFLVILKGENASALNYQVFYDFFKNKNFNTQTILDLLKSEHKQQIQILAGMFLECSFDNNDITFANELYFAISKALKELKKEEDNNNQRISIESENKDKVPKIEKEWVVPTPSLKRESKPNQVKTQSSVNNNNNNNSFSPSLIGARVSNIPLGSTALTKVQKEKIKSQLSEKQREIEKVQVRLLFLTKSEQSSIYFKKITTEVEGVLHDAAISNGFELLSDEYYLRNRSDEDFQKIINSFDIAYSTFLGDFKPEATNRLIKDISLQSAQILDEYSKRMGLKNRFELTSSGSNNNVTKLLSINKFAEWYKHNGWDFTFFQQEWIDKIVRDFEEAKNYFNLEKKEERLLNSEEVAEQKNERELLGDDSINHFNRIEKLITYESQMIVCHNLLHGDAHHPGLLNVLRNGLTQSEFDYYISKKDLYFDWNVNITAIEVGLLSNPNVNYEDQIVQYEKAFEDIPQLLEELNELGKSKVLCRSKNVQALKLKLEKLKEKIKDPALEKQRATLEREMKPSKNSAPIEYFSLPFFNEITEKINLLEDDVNKQLNDIPNIQPNLSHFLLSGHQPGPAVVSNSQDENGPVLRTT